MKRIDLGAVTKLLHREGPTPSKYKDKYNPKQRVCAENLSVCRHTRLPGGNSPRKLCRGDRNPIEGHTGRKIKLVCLLSGVDNPAPTADDRRLRRNRNLVRTSTEDHPPWVGALRDNHLR